MLMAHRFLSFWFFAILIFVGLITETLTASETKGLAGRSNDPPAGFGRLEDLPETVAKIDGVAIHRAELWARAQEARAELASRGIAAGILDREFLRSVLNDLIGSRLLYADLKERGLLPSREEIERRYQEVLASLGTPEERRDLLAGRGTNEAGLRRDVEEAYSIRQWVERSLFPSISVTEEEVKQAYSERPDLWKVPESLRVVQMVVPVAPNANPEEVGRTQSQVEGYRKRILGGEAFEAVAREASGISWEPGANTGTISRGQLPRELEASLFGLETGELSQPVRSQMGFHLFRVLQRQPARVLVLEEVSEQIRRQLREIKLGIRLREIVEGLARKRRVEILL